MHTKVVENIRLQRFDRPITADITGRLETMLDVWFDGLLDEDSMNELNLF
ncbi:hypothetical protein [Mesorhizobium sp. B2-8-9]|nr:hypothetical protein [Mesorhizobium sp. B2-8-9]